MAAFNTGVSPLYATTLEAAVMEVCQRVQDFESAASETPNNMAVNYFTGDNVVQIAATLPFTQAVNASTGATEFVGTDFITDVDWQAGTDVLSTTLGAATLELIQKLQIAEQADSAAGNNVTIAYDTETNIATIAAEIPIAFSNANTDGSIQITAQEYVA